MTRVTMLCGHCPWETPPTASFIEAHRWLWDHMYARHPKAIHHRRRKAATNA